MNKSQLESLPSALELYREMLAGGKNKTLRKLLRKAYREGVETVGNFCNTWQQLE